MGWLGLPLTVTVARGQVALWGGMGVSPSGQ